MKFTRFTQLSFLLLFTCLSTAQAQLYKGVDSEGNVYFSDKKIPNSEIIPMPSPNTIQMPKGLKKDPSAETKNELDGYQSLKITSPANDAVVRSSPGNMTVSLSLKPALKVGDGDSITVYLDGNIFSSKNTSLSVQLSYIDRGTHTVSARVLGKKGKTLITSNTVTFHMKRQSGSGFSKNTAPAPVSNPVILGQQGITL